MKPGDTYGAAAWARLVGVVAALLMAFVPPSITRYTREGAGTFTFTTNPTGRGRLWGEVQRFLYLGPLLLGLSFVLQLVAILAQPAEQ